jgi:hypothetical protein
MNVYKVDDAGWWEKEIKKRSRSRTKVLLYISISIFLIAVVVYAYIEAYIPEGGWIGEYYISRELARFAKFVNLLVGSTGMTAVWGLLSRLQPDSVNYHREALNIVNELEELRIVSNAKAQKMRDCIAKVLAPCDDPRNVKSCKDELLKKAATKLAEIAKNEKYPMPGG